MNVGGLDLPATPEFAEDALRELRRRVPLTDPEFRALKAEELRHAFWVANIEHAEMASRVLDEIGRALESGEGFAGFKKRIGGELYAQWGGPDPLRLDTVFDANVQGAYAAGRHRQMTDPTILRARPIWRLRAILDGRTTKICRSLDGTTQPATSDYWATRTPPLHFRCRSYLETLAPGDAELTNAPDIAAAKGFGAPPPPAGGASWAPDTAKYPQAIRDILERRVGAPPSPPPAPTATPPAQPPPLPPGAGGRVEIRRRMDQGARDAAQIAFDRVVAEEEIAALIPVPDGHTLVINSWREVSRYEYEDHQGVAFDAELLNPEGKRIADVARSFRLHTDGTRFVYHDYFVLDKEHQGLGIADIVVKGALPRYKAAGFDEVRLDAHWVGRYAWAKFGFDWEDDEVRARKVDELEAFLDRRGIKNPRRKARDYASSAPRLARIKTRSGDRIGKEFLLDQRTTPWHGKLKL